MSDKLNFIKKQVREGLHPRSAAIVTALLAIILLLMYFAQLLPSVRPGVLLLLVSLAFFVRSFKKLRGYSFTAWVLVCVGASMFYPHAFIEWGGFKLELLIIPLTQLIMFGMGTTLSLADFARVVKSPWPVFFGMLLQYSVMPVVGYSVARSFGFDGEIAAGIVLIGSCSGGVASNLMAYLAGGNVALSVTMTFFSTLMAPIATPLLMEALAGTFVPIDSVQMMLSILNMIIIPVLAGLVAHEILYGDRLRAQKINKLIMIVVGAVVVAGTTFALGPQVLGPLFSGILLGSILIALITLAKVVMSHILKRPNAWMDTLLPLVSMAGICMVLIIIIAQTYQVLIAVGILLLFAAILHNAFGYILGYWGSRAFGRGLGVAGFRLGFFSTPKSRISEPESRTIAIEVGMQNGGMASGLAIDVLNSYVAALPPNVFGTWMNISGSVLANYWKQRPTDAKKILAPENEPVVIAGDYSLSEKSMKKK